MGIRNFANVPCITCKVDTLHFAMKCRECGTITERPSEARQRVIKRMHAQGKSSALKRARTLHSARTHYARQSVKDGSLHNRSRVS